MDKRSVLGFVLIGMILIGWLIYSNYLQQQKPLVKQQTQQVQDTAKNLTKSIPDTTQKKSNIQKDIQKDTTAENDKLSKSLGLYFLENSIYYDTAVNKVIGQKIITIENKKVIIEFTNQGGCLRSYTMKDYKTWNKLPLQLVDWKKGKELHLLFTSKDGRTINTKDLVFQSAYLPNEKIDIEKTPDFKLRYYLYVSNDSTQQIIKTYSFKSDSYEFDVDYELVNSDKFIPDSKYQIVWETPLNLTEYRSDEESGFAEAFAYMGGELKAKDGSDFTQDSKPDDMNGVTDFVCSRIKYFGVYIIPDNKNKGDGAYLSGYKEKLPDAGLKKFYSIGLKMNIKNDKLDKARMKILLVPMDYKIIKSYDLSLENTMKFPLDFIVRPIAQYFILPFFTFLHSFIPNYGVVIIVFALALKILLNPLTKKQTDSMRKMSGLNPKMTAIREKYKDDSAKANQQIMKLYKEEGINPAAGCLPMILQLPILYALFGVFRSTIELRQVPFIWWINDLAAPDVVLNLPFKIPLFGISQVAGLATLMGITMIIQQKMTTTDPKQKMMVYLMPIMFTFIFYSFPSGLNLYYFMFNLFSIAQQIYNTKFKPAPPPEEPKQKTKKSFFQKMEEFAKNKNVRYKK